MIRKRRFRQRRKGVELYFIFVDFFAPLRLRGNLFVFMATLDFKLS